MHKVSDIGNVQFGSVRSRLVRVMVSAVLIFSSDSSCWEKVLLCFGTVSQEGLFPVKVCLEQF